MYLTSTTRRGLVVVGIALLTALSITGWMRAVRHGSPPPPASSPQNYTPHPENPAMVSSLPGNPEPVEPSDSWQHSPAIPESHDTAVYAASPCGTGVASPPVPPSAAPQAPARLAPSARKTYTAGRRAGHVRYRRVATRKRSWKHSLEIIGGTAAGGALIGGLAGGGKGAGIGALAGGAGGFLFDRITRK